MCMVEITAFDMFKAGVDELPKTEFEQFELFTGTGRDGVITMAILDTYDEYVRVAECRLDDDEKKYAEYLKPLSELAEELDSGVVKVTGKTAPNKSKIRNTMKP